MRRLYTALKLDVAHPLTGEKKLWMPMLPVRLGRGHARARAPIMAFVDSGSPFSLFRADLAGWIGINDIKTGKPAEIGGIKAGAADMYYFHRIKLYIEPEWMVEVWGGFSPALSVAGLLGLNGFFDNFHVTFDHAVSPPSIEVTKIDKVQ